MPYNLNSLSNIAETFLLDLGNRNRKEGGCFWDLLGLHLPKNMLEFCVEAFDG